MTEKLDINKKIENLEIKKRNLERNRNICLLLTAFLAYNTWNSIQKENPPAWFAFAMGAISLCVGLVGFFAHKFAKTAEAELRVFYAEKTEQVLNKEDPPCT